MQLTLGGDDMSHQEKVSVKEMTGKVGKVVLSNRDPKVCCLGNKKRKGKGYYTKMPNPNSIDWLRSSRKVEPVEALSSTVSSRTRKRRLLPWLKV